MAKQKEKQKKQSRDFDAAWKGVIEEHFEPFLEFFYPDIHRDIDFSKPIEILSQELRKIIPVNKKGKRYADVLLKVVLKNGSQRCICVLIHVEVQGKKDPDFPLRMFIYYYRLFDKYLEKGFEVVSLALLTDPDQDHRPDFYSFERWGLKLRFDFPLAKTIDYKYKKDLKEKLETSKNPMALAVQAQLKSLEDRPGDYEVTYKLKEEMEYLFFSKGYDSRYIRSFFSFFDLIFLLPENLDRKLFQDVMNYKEEHKMQRVSNYERFLKEEGKLEGKLEGKQEGKLEGKLEGKQEGKLEGKLEGKQETIIELLKNGVDINIVAKSTGFSREEIEKLVETVH